MTEHEDCGLTVEETRRIGEALAQAARGLLAYSEVLGDRAGQIFDDRILMGLLGWRMQERGARSAGEFLAEFSARLLRGDESEPEIRRPQGM